MRLSKYLLIEWPMFAFRIFIHFGMLSNKTHRTRVCQLNAFIVKKKKKKEERVDTNPMTAM